VEAGVARVVCAIEDPDPRVSGGGFAILKKAGIEVVTGTGEVEARRDLAGFLTRIGKKRPYVILKLAVSTDGKIAAAEGERTRITGPETNARVHLLRAQCDAILAGMETVLVDDPELTSRLPGLESRSPELFVLSRTRALPSDSKLAGRGATVLRGTPAEALGEMTGINRLLVEGGARVARSFLEAGLVDEVQLYRSPVVLGPQGVDALAGLTLEEALGSYALREEETLGVDRLSVYEKSP